MHFHLPKPLHGWRALVGEVGIIVIGVLIALGAEQLVETIHWHDKVESAKANIDDELNQQLDFSDEVIRYGPCAGPYIDALEAAIIRHDTRTIGKLHDTQPPFEPRPWRSTAWQSAMSTEVADHIPSNELGEYAFMFSSFMDMQTLQNSITQNFADATTGRLGGPVDAASTELQLSAAERLRAIFEFRLTIAQGMIRAVAGEPQHNWKPFHRQPSARQHAKFERRAALCERTVKSVAAGHS